MAGDYVFASQSHLLVLKFIIRKLIASYATLSIAPTGIEITTFPAASGLYGKLSIAPTGIEIFSLENLTLSGNSSQSHLLVLK